MLPPSESGETCLRLPFRSRDPVAKPHSHQKVKKNEDMTSSAENGSSNESTAPPEPAAPEPGAQPFAPTVETFRQALLSKRAELLQQQRNQLDALHAPDKHHLADLDEMSSDTVDTDSLCAIVDMESQTLEQIDTALEKITGGTYGICEGCESTIKTERMEALPFAAYCIDCQRKNEMASEL